MSGQVQTIRRQKNGKTEATPTIRCAVYTRKSTDEGLDKEFNSLIAQREAAESYIASQKHEGWICLPDRYDDGGFSGGTMDRPAVKRLLADVDTGKLDCLVVYKVDRLSRSLLDFARIIGTLESHNVSFVSVTQQFTTTNSMGRLTLNILLSFAQFEREIIAERTRDKMSAARRKGKWVGGMPMLGYDIDPKGGRLLVNEDEAARVAVIYDLYLEKKSLINTVKELNSRDWATKRWVTRKGHERGGKSFDKTNLSNLLTNIIYLGKVNYKGAVYEGEHEAIVKEEIWRQAQKNLRRNGKSGGKAVRNKYGALLKGLLYCIPCNTAMSHSYTVKKKNKHYRYYVCVKAQKQGWDSCPTKSLPAVEIEQFVVDRIRDIGTNPELVTETIKQAGYQHKKRMSELLRERQILEREIKQYNAAVQQIISSGNQDTNNEAPTTARFADLQDRIRTAEQRVTGIREEIITLSREAITKQELSTALSLFGPTWELLSPREQSRLINLLLEKIGYDGEKESVALTFRPNGIKALAQEMNFREQEE